MVFMPMLTLFIFIHFCGGPNLGRYYIYIFPQSGFSLEKTMVNVYTEQ